MNLREYERKALFAKYGIELPKGELISIDAPYSAKATKGEAVVLKAQALSGDRKKHGGLVFVENKDDVNEQLKKLFAKKINGEKVDQIYVEEKINAEKEYYASISYDTNVRGPVIALSKTGGSGINKAKIYTLDITLEHIPEAFLKEALADAGFSNEDILSLSKIVQNLWKLFLGEYALLAEINPIFKTKDGRFIAGDAKVILDDEKINPNNKPYVEMGGDIAILASGGGASMLNIDSLLEYGGKPANYVEYSGNPKAEVVENLTKKVLGQKGINGLWVIGNTANFTDIYETLSGFLEGLQSLSDSIGKPKYPILIRRDGPRGREAREMVKKFAEEKDYDIHIYGNEMPMHESAKLIVELAKNYKLKTKN